jgi:hypothetical protein
MWLATTIEYRLSATLAPAFVAPKKFAEAAGH